MTLEKGKKKLLSAHFSSLNFDCHCTHDKCTDTIINDDLVTALEELWRLAGPLTITSGFRCEIHNEEIGGVKDSYHLCGMAADVQSHFGYNGNLLSQYAEKVLEFCNGGIGIAQKWCHLDVRKVRARWTYPIKC